MVQPAALPFLAHFTALRDPRQTAKVLYRRGSNTGYSLSRVDVAGSGDGTLTFSGAVRDGSMCWRSGEAARR